MIEKVERSLARSRETLAAARLLGQEGYVARAISSAYFAAFYAAEAALLLLGQTRSKHSGVVAAFGQMVVKPGGLEREMSRLLSSLFDRRLEADYEWSSLSRAEAEAAIRDAERFVEAVEAWVRERQGKGSGPKARGASPQ